MRTIIAPMLVTLMAGPLAAQKSEGPADFVKDSVIYVDGQPVVAGPKTSFKGVKGMAGIRAGFWVKGEGKRRADGVIVATQLEARPNGMDKGEADIIKLSDQAEKMWVDKKMMFEPADSQGSDPARGGEPWRRLRRCSQRGNEDRDGNRKDDSDRDGEFR